MSLLTKSTALALVSCLGFAAIACGHEKPAVAPEAHAEQPKKLPQKTDASKKTDGDGTGPGDAVMISGDLRSKCNIPSSQEAPKFEFDSPLLQAGGQEMLDLLAKCLTAGPLRGQSMQLIGRADPRGEPEYNMSLGDLRASSVAEYLRQHGVKPEQLQTTSRGELDAVGYDEATWAMDRRVDIVANPKS